MEGTNRRRRSLSDRPGVRRALGLVCLLVLLAWLTSTPGAYAGASTASLPTLFTGVVGSTFRVRPSVIGGWTGDGSGFIGGPHGRPPAGSGTNTPIASFGRIAWSSWTASRAIGVGVPWVNNCTPSCANGTFQAGHSTKVIASRPQGGRFTRLVFTFNYGSGYKPYSFEFVSNGNGPAWVPTELP